MSRSKIKSLVYLLATIILICFYNVSFAIKDYNNFKEIPILHEGRVKPLDTYARVILKSISNKESINNVAASTWLVELLINPTQDYENPIFYIHNPELKNILGLPKKQTSYYSFKQVLPGIKKNIGIITQLEAEKDKKDFFSPAEKQLLNLYHSTLLYFDLSRSLSLLHPEFDVNTIQKHIDTNFKADTNSSFQGKVNYIQLLPYKNKLSKQIDNLLNADKNTQNRHADLLLLAKKFKEVSQDHINTSLKIAIDTSLNPDTEKNSSWLAPWELYKPKIGANSNLETLNLWQSVIYNYYNDKQNQWKDSSNSLKRHSLYSVQDSSNGQYNNLEYRLKLEVTYNQYNFFILSILFYALSLIACLIYFICQNRNLAKRTANASSHLYAPRFKRNVQESSGTSGEEVSISNQDAITDKLMTLFNKCSILLFIVGFISHLTGVIFRVIILQRPPVANLYESILFVGLIIALISIIISKLQKNNIGILIGSLICTILQFIAYSYSKSGDTFGVLIAVLDNNFWLGTHVIAITCGYGCSLLLSALAHIYLIKICFKPSIKNTSSMLTLNRYILALCLLSLFLTFLGTILGGIWADQSWGRFWGWDPKENGALLICLWLTAVLHGKISKQLDNLKFIAGSALTSITVALAWFGVNVLGTGLHSYGFTENIANNLFLFIIFELILILGLYKFAVLTSNNLLENQ